jgi:hypothetical protein
VSEFESPERLSPAREVTLDDVRALMGASTPHFALQLRNRIARLISGLPEGDPARVEGEREITRLDGIARSGEVRGPAMEGEQTLASVQEPDGSGG